MKILNGSRPNGLRQYRYFIYSVFFAAEAWSTLHGKAFYETALYSVALAASIFLGVLQLCGWGARKAE